MKATITVKTQNVLDQIDNLTMTYSPWLHSFEKVGKRWIFKFDREKDEEGDGKGRAVVTVASLQKGLAKMAQHAPSRFANIVNGDSDALDADAFIQCVIFGKLIYG